MARSNKSRGCLIAAGVVLLFIIVIAAVSSGDDDSPAAPSSAAPTPTSDPAAEQVVYEVTGKGKATSISYGGLSNGLSQASAASLPFRKALPAGDGFESYSMTAQNGSGGDDITCRIIVKGKEIATNTSSGPYSVVSCSGTTSMFGG